jgi:hypothetical protein
MKVIKIIDKLAITEQEIIVQQNKSSMALTQSERKTKKLACVEVVHLSRRK